MFRIGRLNISFFARDLTIFAVCFCLISSPFFSWNTTMAEAPKLSVKRARAQAISQAHKQGQMILKFRQDATAEQRAFVLNAFAKDEKPLRGNGRLSKLILKDGMEVANATFNAKQFDAVVEYAEPDYIVTRSDASMQVIAAPNDPYFPQQWALSNTGQSSGVSGADIGAHAGWQTTTGSNATVIAVIDTGIDARHPDLAPNLWINAREAKGSRGTDDDRDGYIDDLNGWNFVNDTNNINDDQGHGTAIAGIIAAQGNDAVGVTGVMWKASLMPLKALDSTGSGAISDVVEAMDFATAHGAGVINCSFGTTGYSQALLDAINRAASSGALVVASAGNDGQDISQMPYYPAGYNVANLITVAATTNGDQLATFSNRSASLVHIAAPGVDVLTTYPNNRYISLTGTSAAAPLVAGVAGLLKSLRGWVSAQTVKKSLMDSARKVGYLDGKVVTGGVVSAGEAIALYVKGNNDGGNGGGGGGGGGGTGGGGGGVGQSNGMNLDFMRANRANRPEPRVTINNVPLTPYDDPEPGTSGLGGYFYQESLPKNSTGKADEPGQDGDPTSGGSKTGQTSINLGSQNANFTAPVVSLGGRGGLGVNLALYYNSNIYVKNGSSIAFNTDKTAVGPGWSIGFGCIEGVPSGSAITTFYDSTSGKYAFLYIEPDGTRHVLAQVGATTVYASYDSTYLEFDNNTKIMRLMNGTQMRFITPTNGGSAVGKRMLPDQIKDLNGNFITIANAEIINGNLDQYGQPIANTSHDWGIDYVTDTLGRTIDFYYESNLLIKVRENRGGTYFNYVVLSYTPITIATNFSSPTITATDPSNLSGTAVWVPWYVEYPTGHNHRFFYTSYGQMYEVEKWVPMVAGQGNGRPVAFTRYDMPSVNVPGGGVSNPGGNTAQTDCPKFSVRQEWAENWSPGSATTNWTALSTTGGTYYVAQYSYEFNAASNYNKVIDPLDRVYRTDDSTDGLTHTSKTYASQTAYSSGTALKTATITYEKDTAVTYTSNLRVANVQITDGSYTRRTNIAYTTVSGASLPSDVKEYAADATTVYRTTHTDYNTSTTYSNKHILGLPSQTLVYAGASTLKAKSTYTYDESAYFDATGLTAANQDSTNYGAGFIAGRANLTTLTQFDVSNSNSRAIKHTKYDMLGNVRIVYDGASHTTELSYNDNFVETVSATYAMVTKAKDGDSDWSGAKYNYYTGQTAQSYHIAGTSGTGAQQNTVTYSYSSVDRLIQVTRPDGGYTTRDYWDNWVAAATYTLIDTGKTRYDFVAYDGAGQTRWNGGDHPDGVSGKYQMQTFAYDVVGRTVTTSNPTAVDGSYSPNHSEWDEDYYFGWMYTTVSYDALDRQTLITRPDAATVQYGYTGCGCAGSQTISVTDERGKQRKTVYDAQGRLAEAYNLTSAGATYSRAVYNYDERDLLQNIKQYNSGTTAYQQRTFTYDGYGRLLTQTTPEAGTVSYEYAGNDQVSKVTDARSLYAQFTYKGRNLLTDVDYSDTTLDVHYTYGEYGERTLMEEKSGSTVMASTSYSYDTYKRLQTETRSFNGLSGTYSVGYTYNYVDALKQISYTANSWTKSVNYDYNYAGGATKVGTNLVSMSGFDTTNNVVSALDYRAWGALQRADYGNGRRLALGYNQKRGQLGSLKLRKTDDTDVVTNLGYDYYSGGGGSGGNNGRVRYITDYLDGNYSLDISYDDHNRLTAYGNYRSYTYDEWNNLKTVSSGNGVGEAPSYTLNYVQDTNGVPTTNRINNTGYAFDSAGNVTNDNNLAYTYDAASRLKTAGGNTYEFDGDGHRVKQQISGYTNAVYYLWSSVLNEPVVEIDSTTPSVFRAYVYGPGGQMLAEQSYDGGFYWLHTDNLGNGRKMTNTSGTVIYRAEYDPHGQMLYEWQTSGATYLNSHKFTGYERDWSTNLDNAKARTFNHNKGRFMQPDPLGLGAADATNPQSLNLYSYVQNDPVNLADPSGLNAQYPTVVGDFSVTISGQSSFEIWVIWQSIFGGPSMGGGGGGGGGGSQGESLPNPSVPNVKLVPYVPCDAIALGDRMIVDQYLDASGVSQFIADKKSSSNGHGYNFTFTDPQAAQRYIESSGYFQDGGFLGTLFHGDVASGGFFSRFRLHDYRAATRGSNALGDRSLQMVVNFGGNRAYADTDATSPYQDLAGFAYHNFVEVGKYALSKLGIGKEPCK